MGGAYGTDPASESRVTAVWTGDGRQFLVIQFRIGDWRTVVLQRETSPDSWISRRDIPGSIEPEAAVTGLLLGPRQIPHPLEDLKRQLAIERRESWGLRNEIRRLQKSLAKPERKRGVRGRRNP